MFLKALAYREKFLSFFLVLHQWRHVRRWIRRGRSHQNAENPLAAHYRRCPIRHRCQRQNASLTEQSAPVVIADFNAPESITRDVRNLVMTGEPFIDECVICRQKVGYAAIFANDVVEEHLRLRHHRFRQIQIPIRKR